MIFLVFSEKAFSAMSKKITCPGCGLKTSGFTHGRQMCNRNSCLPDACRGKPGCVNRMDYEAMGKFVCRTCVNSPDMLRCVCKYCGVCFPTTVEMEMCWKCDESKVGLVPADISPEKMQLHNTKWNNKK